MSAYASGYHQPNINLDGEDNGLWQHKMKNVLLITTLLFGCESSTSLLISNEQANSVDVYVSFGSDSKITAADWSFCTGSGLNCQFSLGGKTMQLMPNPDGKYINATLSFGAPVDCGVTKAEVNINNPSWYDTFDVSLVDGYSNNVEMIYTPPSGSATTLGPPNGETGNEKVYGVFPYGCDICVERQNPPCGITKGKEGCKTGTQYNPDVPCQMQGAVKGGGGSLEVKLK